MIEFLSTGWQDYALLDSGRGRKLEQFGAYTLVRPEPKAIWKPALSPDAWVQAQAEFLPAARGGGGKWVVSRPELPERWQMNYKGLKFWLALEESKQVGVFPENAVHWDWIETKLASTASEEPPNVLNLFGYTGLASLAAARAGAQVTHIDSSKRAVRMGQENQALSGLADKPIRWIVEDALKFAEREVRRGRRYEGILLDPPKYGLGPKKERWEFLEHFERLCATLRQCLSERPLFVVVTAYALESPPEALRPGLERLLKGLGGRLELGELVTLEKSAGRRLSQSITARWQIST